MKTKSYHYWYKNFYAKYSAFLALSAKYEEINKPILEKWYFDCKERLEHPLWYHSMDTDLLLGQGNAIATLLGFRQLERFTWNMQLTHSEGAKVSA